MVLLKFKKKSIKFKSEEKEGLMTENVRVGKYNIGEKQMTIAFCRNPKFPAVLGSPEPEPSDP